jgi:hypothetical protein
MTYADMTVANGQDAGLAWESLVRGSLDQSEREKTRKAPETAIAALRRSTHTGRPLGSPDFVSTLEKSTSRLLAPRKAGRPARPAPDSPQSKLAFIA